MIDNSNRKDIMLIILIFLIAIVLCVFSYFFLLSNYKKLEISQNKTDINNFLVRLDEQINTIKNTAKDYAFWDDTYYFVKNRNQDYIYKNFKEGNNTLKNLNLNFLIIEDKNKEILFSKYTKNLAFINNITFETVINKKFSKTNPTGTIFEYQNRLFYLIKENILKSGAVGESAGYLYLGRYLDKIELSKYNANNLKQNHKKDATDSSKIVLFKSSFFEKIEVTNEFEKEIIKNDLHFYGAKKSYLFSLELQNNLHILKEGKKTIYIYNSIIFIFIFIILLIAYKYKKMKEQAKINLEKLIARRTKKIITTMTELKVVNEKLYNLAHTDDLTKIHNRRNYFLLSHKAFEQSFLNKKYISLIMIDLDGFKNINDTYGHDIGDKILIKFANTIKPFINEGEVFGRLGGEEFAITLPHCDIEGANLKAEVLRSCIEKMSLDVNQKIIKVTASFGVSDNNSAHSIDEMLLRADKLLYSAKKSGKNLVRSRLTLF